MNRSIRTLSVAVLIALLVTSTVVVDGQSNSAPTAEPTTGVGDSANESANNGSNSTAPRHQDPERVREEGDLGEVEGWLEARLTKRLDDSMVRLERGQYEKARGLVGDEYSDQLGRYVEVQRSMRTNDTENNTEQFRRGEKSQRKFIDSVREYRRTHRQYQNARQNGNTERARQHARKLNELAERTNKSGTSLKSTYRNISRTTSADLNQSSRQVTTISRNVTQTQSNVEDTVFEKTNLNVRATSNTASFLNPVELDGTLTTANGTAVSNRNVTLAVGNQTIETETNREGQFRASYRPTTVPLQRNELEVEYQPQNESVYLGANDTVETDITQVEPTLTLRKTPNRTAFDEQFSISGTVGSDGVSAGNVPVVISIGDRKLGETETAADGTFTVRTRLPSSVQDGRQQLRATIPLSNRALASANASTDVFVEQTNTSVSINATRNRSTVEARGRLTDENGTAVAQRTVVFRVEGNRVGEATTGANGSYATTLELPPSVDGDESVEVVAVHQSDSSNLGTARASAVVEGTKSARGLFDRISIPWAGAALFTLVFLIGSVLVRSRRADRQDEEDTEEAEDDPVTEPFVDEQTEESDERSNESDELDELDAARTYLSSGDHERAVRAGYGVFRRHLVDEYELDSAATPRELRNSVEPVATDREYQTLDDLTACFERVAFASRSVSTDTVSVLLDAVEGIVAESDDERVES